MVYPLGGGQAGSALARASQRLMALLILLALVAGCGGGGAGPAATITFMVFGDVAERRAYEELVAAFHAQRADIRVELLHVPSQEDYRARLGADFAAGTPADVVLINYRRYAGLAAKGALEPLGPYLARSTVLREADFYPQVLEVFRRQGTLICIPQNLSSLVVYYNKALFDQAGLAYPQTGWTWQDFLATSRALTRDQDGDGTPEQYGLGTEASIFRAAPFIWQNGGELVDHPTAPRLLALAQPEARAALQWFIDLQVAHRVVPSRLQEQAESSESRFLNGRLGMYLNSRRGVPSYRTITAFDWDVAPLPRGVVEAGILHADGYCLPSLSRWKEAAWAFTEYANSPAGQTIVARSGRTVPSLRAVAESPAFLDPAARPRASRVFLDGIPSMRAVPVMETWVDVEAILGEELERAFYGEISLDEMLTEGLRRTREYMPR